ncbi:MAG: hypothetical protein O9331_10525 [Acidovorax sp.]|nr:hypothetical protein [Acidovorax sp.]
MHKLLTEKTPQKAKLNTREKAKPWGVGSFQACNIPPKAIIKEKNKPQNSGMAEITIKHASSRRAASTRIE